MAASLSRSSSRSRSVSSISFPWFLMFWACSFSLPVNSVSYPTSASCIRLLMYFCFITHTRDISSWVIALGKPFMATPPHCRSISHHIVGLLHPEHLHTCNQTFMKVMIWLMTIFPIRIWTFWKRGCIYFCSWFFFWSSSTGSKTKYTSTPFE